MRRLPITLALSALAAAVLVTACGGGNNANKGKATVAAPPSVTRPAAPSSAAGGSPAAVNVAGGTARPGVIQTPTPRNTQVANPSPGCAAQASGPNGSPVAAVPPTQEPPFVPGQQPVRPPVDLAAFTVNPAYIPSGFTSLDADQKKPVSISASDIASTATNPQATLAHLNNIGFLGGRQQGWSAQPLQGRIPTIYVLHLVFNTDAGASEFLRNPPLGALICARPEPGPELGQEALHIFYQYQTPGGAGPADGHSVYWRCGRVVIGVNDSSIPGLATQGIVDDLARKIQGDYVKTQPCS